MNDGRQPYTIDQLLQLWRGTVDPSYSQPFLTAVGSASIDADEDIADPTDDHPTRGLEVFTQNMAQSKRVSAAVVRTTEALYILPWSGQVDEASTGQRFAIVTLDIERSKRFELGLVFPAGQQFEEQQIDASKEGSLTVLTERRYALSEALVFAPGERGPKSVAAVAVRSGYGYNNPLPDTIKSFFQPGDSLANDFASIVATLTNHELVMTVNPDVVSPLNIGQYIELTAGANPGRVARIIDYRGPDSTAPHGGIAVLAKTTLLRVTTVVGTFVPGETITQGTTMGTFVGLSSAILFVEGSNAAFSTGAIAGGTSGATATVTVVESSGILSPETGTASWRILGWTRDAGFESTNIASPTGGALATLDELGRERNIDRSANEEDDLYRERVHRLPDVVSPYAILRTANRILARFGAMARLRETGTTELPGFYCDVDACDYDFDARPADKYKVTLDYAEFRAFFLLGLPRLSAGEFGFFYDAGPFGFYDASPFDAYYDGYALEAARAYQDIWRAVNEARAGGVGFALVLEDDGVFPVF